MGKSSLVVQWLRLLASTAGGTSLTPGWRTKILHATCHGQNIKEKKRERERKKIFLESKKSGTSPPAVLANYMYKIMGPILSYQRQP